MKNAFKLLSIFALVFSIVISFTACNVDIENLMAEFMPSDFENIGNINGGNTVNGGNSDINNGEPQIPNIDNEDVGNNGNTPENDGENTIHTHTLTKIKRTEATCFVDGNIEYYTCSGCSKFFMDADANIEIAFSDTVIDAAHTVDFVSAVDATCIADGNINHYHCSVCEKNYDTWECANEITNVVIAKNDNHVGDIEIRDEKEATEEEEGYTGDMYCIGCGEKVGNGLTIPKLEHTHAMTLIAEKAASCAENGNIEHFTCSKCGKYYMDDIGLYEITLEDIVIPASHLNESVDAKNPTCTENGNIKHWICNICIGFL